MITPELSLKGTTASRYEELVPLREPFLKRARLASSLTIPSLIPPTDNRSDTLPQPYQAVGARGLNNLAGKLLMVLLPPNTPFFRLVADPSLLKKAEQLGEGSDISATQMIEEALSEAERVVQKEIDVRGLRSPTYESMKHLETAGNVLAHFPEEKGMRVFPLNQYVVDRDPEGNVLEIIVKEVISPKTIYDEQQRERIQAVLKTENKKTLDLFTHVELLDDGSWSVHQEVKGETLVDSEGTYAAGQCSWLPLRWSRIDGESYGRGLIEEYQGDLLLLERLSKAMSDFAQAASKINPMVKPGSTTKPKDLMKPSGEIIIGNPDDIGYVKIDKYPDFQVVQATAQGVESRLSQVFLIASQRQGERVTAEEIRWMANELENALGGIYTSLTEEFQLPLIRILLKQLEKKNKLPKLKDDQVHPAIITGLDALGRNQDLMRLDAFIGSALQTFGPAAMSYIKVGELLSRRATALGIDTKGLVKTPEEMQAEQEAAQKQELLKSGAPSIVKAASDQMLAQQQQPSEEASNG